MCDRLKSWSLSCSTAFRHRAKAASRLPQASAIWPGRPRCAPHRPAVRRAGHDDPERALPLPDQLGAEGSALRWLHRAEAIASWSDGDAGDRSRRERPDRADPLSSRRFPASASAALAAAQDRVARARTVSRPRVAVRTPRPNDRRRAASSAGGQNARSEAGVGWVGTCKSIQAPGRPSGASQSSSSSRRRSRRWRRRRRSASRSRASRESARRACSPSCGACRGAGLPRARRLGDGVRARPAVQRLGRRPRRLRRLAGARPGQDLGRRGGRRARRGAARRCGPAGDATASVADERYRTHRAVRRLLELLAADRPLVLGARRPALERRRVDRAARQRCCGAARMPPSCWRWRFGRGRRRRVCLPRWRLPSVRRIALEQLSEAQATLAAGRARSADRRRRSTGTAAATPSTSSSSRAAGDDGDARAAPNGAAASTRPACRRRSRRRSPRSSHRSPSTERDAARGGGGGRRAVRARSRGDDRRAVRCRGAHRARCACSRVISCARQRCRAASSSAIRSCAGRSTSRLRAAGGLRRTRGLRPSWPREAPPPASAPTTSSSRPSRGTRRRSSCCSRRVRRRRRALLPWRRVGSRRRCDCSARPMRERQVDVRVALASALRAVGELEQCRATLLEAIDLLPAGAAERRVELTALCAAVEHWLGRHEDAHQRLMRAWDDLPDRSTAAAAVLQIELAVDGLYELDFEQTAEMGRARFGDRASSGRSRADRSGRVGVLPGRDRRRANRRRARVARRGAGRGRPAHGRGAGAAPRGSLLPRLGRDVPRAVRRTRSLASSAGSRSRARPATGAC